MPVARLAAAALAILVVLPACAARRGAEPPAAPAALPTPAPVTVTPARFDAYVLALRNVRAAHPTFGDEGPDRLAVRETMREAVAKAGLTLEEFANLHDQVQADPVLKAEAERRVAALPAPAKSGARPSGRPTP